MCTDERRGICVQLESMEETPEIRHTSMSALENTHNYTYYDNLLFPFKCVTSQEFYPYHQFTVQCIPVC